jgi:hypothetical protein
MATGKLDVLNCPGCGAPVPLGEGDAARCVRCAAEVPLAPAHRALRDAERAKHAANAAALDLFKRLGTPPSRLARWWASVPLGWIYLFAWPVLFVAAGLLVAVQLDRLAPLLGGMAADMLSQTAYFGIVAAVLFLVMGVPLALAVYGHRRTNARRDLQAALAAIPPPSEGGPAQCRACGGALTVPAGALGTNCDYCGADNLVRMPDAWVGSLRRRAARLGRTLAAAASEDLAMRAATRRRLLRQTGFLAALIFVPSLAFGRLLDGDAANRWPPPFAAAAAEESRRGLLDPKGAKTMREVAHGPREIPLGPRFVGAAEWRFAYDGSECGPVRGAILCERAYLVPLLAKETLSVTLRAAPPPATRIRVALTQRGNGIFGDDWRPLLRGRMLRPGETAEFAVTLSGWYRLEIDSIEIDPRLSPQLRLTIATAIGAR